MVTKAQDGFGGKACHGRAGISEGPGVPAWQAEEGIACVVPL